jgi:site-specific DNA-methyltransferase (adenine-specific)
MSERAVPFHYVLIDKILIGERFRKDVSQAYIDELRTSINNRGLLHPIVIDDSYNLLAGFCRLTACKQLEWLEVPCHFKGELSELQRLEIELDENVARKDFTWDERVALREKIHEVKSALYGHSNEIKPQVNEAGVVTRLTEPTPGWTLQDTANLVGSNTPRISLDLAMARIIKYIPQLKKYDEKEAWRVVRRLADDIERELSVRQTRTDLANVWCGDCAKVLRHVPDASVDCIIADPPYGTDVQELANVKEGNETFGHRQDSHFDDSKTTAQTALAAALPEMVRVLKDNGHAYFFFAITEYSWVLELLVKHFGEEAVDPIPLIWLKGKERWGTGDWEHKYARQYEGIFFVYSKRRRLAQVHGNIIGPFPAEEATYTAQKPINMYSELISQSTNEGELVLDPFAGGGSIGVAAVQLGRKFFLVEQNESMYKLAQSRVQDALEEKARASIKETTEAEQQAEQEDAIDERSV